MAISINRATLVGNLGADPELRSTPSGASVCTLNIATTERYKDRQTGEWKELTDWHRVVLWERLAEVAGQYLKKGNKVFIEGKIKTRSYEKDGVTRYITEIRATDMIMMGAGQGGGTFDQGQPPQQSGYNAADVADTGDDDEVPF